MHTAEVYLLYGKKYVNATIKSNVTTKTTFVFRSLIFSAWLTLLMAPGKASSSVFVVNQEQ